MTSWIQFLSTRINSFFTHQKLRRLYYEVAFFVFYVVVASQNFLQVVFLKNEDGSGCDEGNITFSASKNFSQECKSDSPFSVRKMNGSCDCIISNSALEMKAHNSKRIKVEMTQYCKSNHSLISNNAVTSCKSSAVNVFSALLCSSTSLSELSSLINPERFKPDAVKVTGIGGDTYRNSNFLETSRQKLDRSALLCSIGPI